MASKIISSCSKNPDQSYFITPYSHTIVNDGNHYIKFPTYSFTQNQIDLNPVISLLNSRYKPSLVNLSKLLGIYDKTHPPKDRYIEYLILDIHSQAVALLKDGEYEAFNYIMNDHYYNPYHWIPIFIKSYKDGKNRVLDVYQKEWTNKQFMIMIEQCHYFLREHKLDLSWFYEDNPFLNGMKDCLLLSVKSILKIHRKSQINKQLDIKIINRLTEIYPAETICEKLISLIKEPYDIELIITLFDQSPRFQSYRTKLTDSTYLFIVKGNLPIIKTLIKKLSETKVLLDLTHFFLKNDPKTEINKVKPDKKPGKIAVKIYPIIYHLLTLIEKIDLETSPERLISKFCIKTFLPSILASIYLIICQKYGGNPFFLVNMFRTFHSLYIVEELRMVDDQYQVVENASFIYHNLIMTEEQSNSERFFNQYFRDKLVNSESEIFSFENRNYLKFRF